MNAHVFVDETKDRDYLLVAATEQLLVIPDAIAWCYGQPQPFAVHAHPASAY